MGLTASVFQNEFLVSRSEPEAHSNWYALHLVSGAAARSQSTLASTKESSQVHITHPMPDETPRLGSTIHLQPFPT